MSFTLFIGIDVSKATHDIAIVDAEQKLLTPRFRIAESRAGYEQLRARLAQIAERHQAERVHFGMEATGEYWKNLYHFLRALAPAYVLSVLHPVQTKKFAQAELRRAKTDPVNALDIARFVVQKRPRPWFERAPVWDAIKDLDRQIATFTKQHSMTLNKLRTEMAKVAPEIEQAMGNPISQQVLALLAHYPTAAALAQAPMENLLALRYGTSQRRFARPLLARMKALCENSIAHKKGPGADMVMRALLARLKHEEQAIAELKAQLFTLAAEQQTQPSMLTSIKGVTVETALALEAYIGDVHRFARAKQLVAFFGMNPTVYLSGTSIRGVSRLEKKGSGVVRHKLFMIVLNLIRHRVEPFYGYYTRLVSRGKPKLVALAATMRKLLVIMYSMLKHQQAFEPNKKP